jgi:hypothetical protein
MKELQKGILVGTEAATSACYNTTLTIDRNAEVRMLNAQGRHERLPKLRDWLEAHEHRDPSRTDRLQLPAHPPPHFLWGPRPKLISQSGSCVPGRRGWRVGNLFCKGRP